MLSLLLTLGHAGPGSTWQAMVVVAGLVLAGTLVAAGFGAVNIGSMDDLVVPFAAAAIASSLGALGHSVISDGIGWGLPIAMVAALTLLLGGATDLDLRFPAPLPMAAVALAGVGAFVLYVPLTIALHPPAELVPLSDDAAVIIVAPDDGGSVEAGDATVRVRITEGSLGPAEPVPLEELPLDPEEAAGLDVVVDRVQDGEPVDRVPVEVTYDQECTVDDPCTEVAFDVPLPDPGTYRITVDLTRGDGVSLSPVVRDRITLTVG
ncbi:MAG: hypothetical protein JJT89_07490 [Nitriliruptoraceae bacterium]|nr:hypothetical protein [Nitriliruptoraceae bacterium]